jgi:glycosyltransferase involved in cell wall biosynthesis
MRLSIVIPLYNKEKFIDRCLKSLLDQNLSPEEYEIIIVDDGSTDSSYTLACAYAEKHPNIVAHRQKNGGAGAARNTGFELAKGDYIYFLDADDYIAKNSLEFIVELSEQHNLEILGFNTKHVNNTEILENTTTEHPENMTVTISDGITFIAERNFRNEAWWYIINREFLINTGIKFTEGRFIQDSIFTATLLLRPQRISKINYDVHRFVKVENSATTNKKQAHILKFIDDLVYAIGRFDVLIKNMDSSDKNYQKVLKVYKSKQQSFVFTIFLKAFRCPAIGFKDLNKILVKLKELDVYPINRKIGGIGGPKTRTLYNYTFIPVFNNKPLLYLGLKLNRLKSSVF